jgi:hypothetical protein
MKTSKVGLVAVAILLVVTGVGFGIAQAGGTHSEQPVSSFEDMESTQVAKSPAEDMQMENPVETGSLPAGSNADFDPFSRSGS